VSKAHYVLKKDLTLQDSPIPFDNTYIKLPNDFYSPATPDTPPSPQLIIYNKILGQELGLKNMSDTELTNIFSGKTTPEGAKPVAMIYSGHQFGHFSPRLGDGRALLIGEVINKQNNHIDIHMKGSGPTEYSRRGDGKATLGPVLREYLVSEAMHKLGVPTTRALAATLTGEAVQREELLPGGVITRTSESLIRVGTFELFARHGDLINLKKLLNYTVNRNFPELKQSPDLALDFFKNVMKLQASLTAKWMSIGFIHGVMNTDNSSIIGTTIDYGPCAFMDHFDSNRVFSFIDKKGRYRYNNQPTITHWNLSRLAECLIVTYDEKDQEQAVIKFEEALDSFESTFSGEWLNYFTPKFGVLKPEATDMALIKTWLDYIEKENLDFTNSFVNLSKSLKEPTDFFKRNEEFNNFYSLWNNRLNKQGASPDTTIKLMSKTNPIYIPRNHLIEEMISEAINGSFDSFHEFNKILSTPFNEQDVSEKYKLPPSSEQIVPATFCGT